MSDSELIEAIDIFLDKHVLLDRYGNAEKFLRRTNHRVNAANRRRSESHMTKAIRSRLAFHMFFLRHYNNENDYPFFPSRNNKYVYSQALEDRLLEIDIGSIMPSRGEIREYTDLAMDLL